ncbi:elongation of very long chain fatty acids protein 4-like isoform X1 [Varroa jacobsoni]|uniref:Elongation of very long chain fatty acids protein n=2 Tax=Varroa TaxID=62624 RepID=A0A7M7JKI2_VARDE|nr:elongation of very long chain fatty acids protein 4-like [Varroa destructor]XP_022686719.1 elongation of very long chain fatty acids protein 4-like isoform X1 [Varroa jacobsoni]
MASDAVLTPVSVARDDIYFLNLRIDPRVKDYMFVGNAWFPIIVCGSYLWFVYKGGPAFMQNRKPYDLRRVIQIHNLFMVVTNIFFFYKFITNSYLANYSLLCQGMTYATDHNSMEIVHYGYWYLMLRILDFLDTVFFVLRKKFDHVSFHHVSHHFCCVFSGHLWVTLGMDGHTLAGLCLNSCIHIFMYFYYFLASLGPKIEKYLWWKKYLTKAQIYQHIFLVLHGLIPVFYDCGYPKFFIYLAVPQGLLGLVLFLNFYVASYSRKRQHANATSAAKANGHTETEDCQRMEQRVMEKEIGLKKDR